MPTKNYRRYVHVGIVMGGLILASVMATLFPQSIATYGLIVVFVLFCVIMFRDVLFLTMVFLVPFVGITVSVALPTTFAFLFEGVVDAPLSDILAGILVIVCGIRMLYQETTQKLHRHVYDHAPWLSWYFPFLCVAALTIFRAPSELQSASFHYYVRFVLFSYVAFVCLPYWLIVTKQRLYWLLQVVVYSGVATALYGLISLMFSSPLSGLWHRVSPISFGSFAPLLTNHNLLTEALLLSLPFVVFCALHEQEKHRAKYALCALLFGVLVVLTFGRAAWIALAVQIGMWWYTFRDRFIFSAFRLWPIVIPGIALVAYMIFFSQSEYVQSSTNARVDLTKFAITQAGETPFFGRGIGTFMPVLAQSRAFIFEYGDPIEAHGFVQKLLFETGIIGLSAFILFFIVVIIALRREIHQTHDLRYRDLLVASSICITSMLVFQLFTTSYFNGKLWLPVGIAYVVLRGKWKFNREL